MTLERAVGVGCGPAAAAHIVALVGALPRELNARRPRQRLKGRRVQVAEGSDRPSLVRSVRARPPASAMACSHVNAMSFIQAHDALPGTCTRPGHRPGVGPPIRS